MVLQLSLPSSADVRRSELSFDIPLNVSLSSGGDLDQLASEWVSVIASEVRALLSSIDSPDSFKTRDFIGSDGRVALNPGASTDAPGSSAPGGGGEQAQDMSREEIYSKFQVSQGSAVCTFGDPTLFHRGLDARIGAPDFRVELAIRAEHCGSADSDDEFRTFNYGGTVTTPKLEYEFVCEPDLARKDYPGMSGPHPRKPIRLESLRNHKYYSCLSRAELLALRLFTGPMYMKYNAVLRQYPLSICEGLKGNQYRTTIHAIVSGVIKLSQVTVLPPSRNVYRGLGGMLLPDRFWQPDAFGCRGGVDFGFMSTTSNEDVAIMYSGRASSQLSTIFEIDVGQIDRGASISWLSQYPEEEEFLVPPLSNLEVVGSPRLKRIANGSDILVIKLRVNVNVKSKTMDELIATRKRLHLDTLRNLLAETERELAIDPRDNSALVSFKDLIASEEGREAEYFNVDENFRKCQEDMVNMKIGTINQDRLVRLCRRLLQGQRSNEVDDQRLAGMETQLEAYKKMISGSKFQYYVEIVGVSNEALISTIKGLVEQLAIVASRSGGRDDDKVCAKIEEILQSVKSSEWMSEALYESFSADVYESVETAKLLPKFNQQLNEMKSTMEVVDIDQERGVRIASREASAFTTAHNFLRDAVAAARAEVESDVSAMGQVYCFAMLEEERVLSTFPEISPADYYSPWNLRPSSCDEIFERDKAFCEPLIKSIDGLKFSLFPSHDTYRACILGLRFQREMKSLHAELESLDFLNMSAWFEQQRSNFARRASAVRQLIDIATIKSKVDLLAAEDEARCKEIPTVTDALASIFDEESTVSVFNKIKSAFPNDEDIVEQESYWYGSALNEIGKIDIDDEALNNINDAVRKMVELRIGLRKGDPTVDTEAVSHLGKEIASVLGLESVDAMPHLSRTVVAETAMRALGQRYGESLYFLTQGNADFGVATNCVGLFHNNKVRESLEMMHLLLSLLESKKNSVTRDKTLRLYRRNLVCRMLASMVCLLHNIEQMEDDLALLDKACALSSEVFNDPGDSDIKSKRCMEAKIYVYKLLARELEWRQATIQIFNLDPKSTKWLDLSDRLRYGFSKLCGALSPVATISDVMLQRLQSMPPSNFGDAMECARWRAALYVIAGVADDPELPWFTDFELKALTTTYSDIDVVRLGLDKRFDDWSMEYCERHVDGKITLFDITRCDDTIGSEFGFYQGTFYKSVKDKRSNQIGRGWEYGLNCRNEARFIKELLWRCLAASTKSSFADLNRVSINRALELASYTVRGEAALEIEFSEWQLGYGGFSMEESHMRIIQCFEPGQDISAIETLLRSEYRWFGALSTSFGRVGIYLMATLWRDEKSPNKVGLKEISLPSLSTMERCFLVSFTLFTVSNMAYKIGAVCQTTPPIEISRLATWRGSTRDRWDPYYGSLCKIAGDHIEMMHDILDARELVAFYLDGRYRSHSRYLKHGSEDLNTKNRNETRINGWNNTQYIKELCLMQHNTLARDKSAIRSICRLVTSLKTASALNLYNCELSGAQFVELMHSLKSLPHIKSLDFGANAPRGSDIVAGLADYAAKSTEDSCGGICNLVLINCKLSSDDIVIILKQLLQHPSKIKVDLNGNQLSDEGALRIAEMVNACDKLKNLSVSFLRNSNLSEESHEMLINTLVAKGGNAF